MNQRARTLETLRRIRRQLLATDQSALDEVIHIVTDLYNQDAQLHRMLRSWKREFGPNDGCVRALEKIINGEPL